ncbi:MAG: hypothetical protein COA57_00280 [Flavobacteriales bacterium]|nr:MAG: hypothetical protein COA57_00280 [Flavobacteriales bacterium]
MKKAAYILCFLLFCYTTKGQNSYSLNIIQTDSTKIDLKEISEASPGFSSENEREKYLRKTLILLYDKGYITASFDSLKRDSSVLTAFLKTGKSYQWAYLQKGNVDEGILSEIGYRDKLFYNRPVSGKNFSRLMENILIYCENNGYPFSTVKLDSIEFGENSVSAVLNLTKNKKCTVDSIKILGDAKVAPVYLYNYIRIKPGDLYSEKLIREIASRIRELPFVSEKESPQVIFTKDFTKLALNLKHKKASHFSGVLGLLPDEESDKVLITGDARLKLQNALGRGELIDFNWRKLQTKTQDLKILFNYPFILNTPFGADLDLKIYWRDTLFVTIDQRYGIQYILKGGNYFKAFLHNRQSNLISTQGYENITAVPDYADISALGYGLGFKTEKLDYRINPRKGYSIDLLGSIGNKKIRQNPALPAQIYDSLKLKTIQYNSQIAGDVFIPLWKRATFNIGFTGGYLFNEQLFTNELYRIGGLKTLRGFDEESINASSYSIATLEFRYLLEQNSYFHLFWNGAYYENTSVNNRTYGTPFGFGAGISFETKAGIFAVSYAFGKHIWRSFGEYHENPISWRDGKIHFGFVSLF